MMNPALRPDASLFEFLVARARAASDGRLVVDVLVGAGIALGSAAWRPVGWLTISGAALALAAFGLWGITDREVRERDDEAGSARVIRVLRGVRMIAGLVGFSCAVGAVFSALGLALGTWIS
jgi:Flp pilus assembly pilin Flp